jgi:hypothetical protein
VDGPPPHRPSRNEPCWCGTAVSWPAGSRDRFAALLLQWRREV